MEQVDSAPAPVMDRTRGEGGHGGHAVCQGSGSQGGNRQETGVEDIRDIQGRGSAAVDIIPRTQLRQRGWTVKTTITRVPREGFHIYSTWRIDYILSKQALLIRKSS